MYFVFEHFVELLTPYSHAVPSHTLFRHWVHEEFLDALIGIHLPVCLSRGTNVSFNSIPIYSRLALTFSCVCMGSPLHQALGKTVILQSPCLVRKISVL